MGSVDALRGFPPPPPHKHQPSHLLYLERKLKQQLLDVNFTETDRQGGFIGGKNVSRTFECIVYKVPWKKISKISNWSVACGRIIPQSPSLSLPCRLISTQSERYVSNHGWELGRKRRLPPSFSGSFRVDTHILILWDQNNKSVLWLSRPGLN